jgi:hypothetical protein
LLLLLCREMRGLDRTQGAGAARDMNVVAVLCHISGFFRMFGTF